jgi:hypothetical protein
MLGVASPCVRFQIHTNSGNVAHPWLAAPEDALEDDMPIA